MVAVAVVAVEGPDEAPDVVPDEVPDEDLLDSIDADVLGVPTFVDDAHAGSMPSATASVIDAKPWANGTRLWNGKRSVRGIWREINESVWCLPSSVAPRIMHRNASKA